MRRCQTLPELVRHTLCRGSRSPNTSHPFGPAMLVEAIVSDASEGYSIKKWECDRSCLLLILGHG